MEDFKPYPTQAKADDLLPAQLMVSDHSTDSPTQQQVRSKPDQSTFDVIKAVQYGALDRVKELVENGLDVQEPDKENVTLLHWASINNRLDIAKYLINQGAIIDQLGGDLNSTPLHWGARQGHLPMVVLLMQYGADPSLRDGEGVSAIHLACQYGHTAIVAYLIAKGQDPNMLDGNGMSPLMWACYRTFSVDPTRLLLTLGASPNLQDKHYQNTALHWATAVGNTAAVTTLLQQGADSFIENSRHETPLDVAMSRRNGYIAIRIKENRGEASTGNKKGSKVFRQYVMWCFPGTLMILAGLIPDLSIPYSYKFGLALVAMGLVYVLLRFFVDNRATKVFPIATAVSTKVILNFTFFAYFWPYLSDLWLKIGFVLSSFSMCWSFWKCWRFNPGVVKNSQEDQKRTIIELAETTGLNISQFCTTCLIKRPIRSKHCSSCDKCIARFDHHCPWVDNCIGSLNHRYFIMYLGFLPLAAVFYLVGNAMYWLESCNTSFEENGVWIFIGEVMSCSPWTFIMSLQVAVYMVWVAMLFVCQFYQVIYLGVTTNERMNHAKYQHFRDPKRPKGPFRDENLFNPFHRGVLRNFVDFFECTCMGLCRPMKVDWGVQFSTDLSQSGATNFVSTNNRENYQFV
ncbi:palmitoyltransferase ZDHHC17-like [Asterias amurensis]|uniref:palmitoyltransferase ZDHHC17-like n=1 Tax=Asterias amurensis TaxID=7602 RepID=UPI003AB90FEE